jgi:deoxyribonuclease V
MPLVRHRQIPLPASDTEGHGIQETLAREVRREMGWGLVTGVDVAYAPVKGSRVEMAYAVAVTVSTSNWRPVEIQRWKGPAPMAYMSGLLGFREADPMLEALLKLTNTPDVIFVDGNGQAHPRQFGLACHIGLSLDHPTIGIAKNYPAGCGEPKTANFGKAKRGNKMAIMLGPHKVGYELVTQDDSSPIYVSVGNRLGLDESISLVIKATPFYRLPEPIRAADQEANKFRDEDQ